MARYERVNLALVIARGWILIGVMGVTALAVVCPRIGAPGGILHLEIVQQILTSVIFFGEGSRLDVSKFKLAIGDKREIIFVQSYVYGILPVLVKLGSSVFLSFGTNEGILKGMLTLVSLPPSPALTMFLARNAQVDQNLVLANCLTSSILGTLLSPILLTVLCGVVSYGAVLKSLLELVAVVLIPVSLGIFTPVLIKPKMRLKKLFVDGSILIILYISTCEAFLEANGLLDIKHALSVILLVFIVLASNFTLCWILAKKYCKKHFASVLICSTSRTIILGARLTHRLHAMGSITIVPILMYQPAQTFVASSASLYFRYRNDVPALDQTV